MDEFDLVSVNDLRHGDYILLDNGEEVMVRAIEPGPTKSRCCLRLKGLAPIVVSGYWRPFIRRLKR